MNKEADRSKGLAVTARCHECFFNSGGLAKKKKKHLKHVNHLVAESVFVAGHFLVMVSLRGCYDCEAIQISPHPVIMKTRQIDG